MKLLLENEFPSRSLFLGASRKKIRIKERPGRVVLLKFWKSRLLPEAGLVVALLASSLSVPSLLLEALLPFLSWVLGLVVLLRAAARLFRRTRLTIERDTLTVSHGPGFTALPMMLVDGAKPLVELHGGQYRVLLPLANGAACEVCRLDGRAEALFVSERLSRLG